MKHKLALYKTQSVEPNYIDHKFSLIFCLEPPVQQLGGRNPNTIELASWLVYVLCYLHDIKSLLQSLLNTPWKYILLIHFTFSVKAPLSLPIIVKVYISHYNLDIYNWWQDQFQYVSYQKKCISPCCFILFTLNFRYRVWSIFLKLNLHF